MKCTIKSIRHIALKDNRYGSRVEGFVAVDINSIPAHIHKWISEYEGIKKVPYEDGLFIASWGETVCSERDNYDAGLGAHIAESKAKAKIYRFLRNFAERMANHHETIANDYHDVYLKYDHCVGHEENHAYELGNQNNE